MFVSKIHGAAHGVFLNPLSGRRSCYARTGKKENVVFCTTLQNVLLFHGNGDHSMPESEGGRRRTGSLHCSTTRNVLPSTSLNITIAEGMVSLQRRFSPAVSMVNTDWLVGWRMEQFATTISTGGTVEDVMCGMEETAPSANSQITEKLPLPKLSLDLFGAGPVQNTALKCHVLSEAASR